LAQAQLAQQQQQLAAVFAANGLDYSAMDPNAAAAAAAAAAGGALLADQRRFLGQNRSHPYQQQGKNKAA
jgi:hypothetical protein